MREKFVAALQKAFPDIGLKYSIGGQISFDVFPIGWDKTFCLSLLDLSQYREVHFFGDKAYPVSGTVFAAAEMYSRNSLTATEGQRVALIHASNIL